MYRHYKIKSFIYDKIEMGFIVEKIGDNTYKFTKAYVNDVDLQSFLNTNNIENNESKKTSRNKQL
jgi:hypothetical protein